MLTAEEASIRLRVLFAACRSCNTSVSIYFLPCGEGSSHAAVSFCRMDTIGHVPVSQLGASLRMTTLHLLTLLKGEALVQLTCPGNVVSCFCGLAKNSTCSAAHAIGNKLAFWESCAWKLEVLRKLRATWQISLLRAADSGCLVAASNGILNGQIRRRHCTRNC